MRMRQWCAVSALLWAQVGAAQTSAAATHAVSAARIAAMLAEAGLSLAEARLHLPGAVSARTDAPQLKITGAEQRTDGSLQVRISCRSAVECMPFFVTVDAEDDRAALAAFAAHTFEKREAMRSNAAAGVTVGARVMLELADAQMHIQLPAVVIDTGVPGAEVRVASLDRKHTWRGVVVDAATVRGGLQ